MIVYKTSSAGNEFVHAESGPGVPGPDPASLARRVCREFAADGAVFCSPRGDGVGFEIWNRDGSRAELSGNGMAGCAAVHFLRRRGGRELTLHTAVGPRRVREISRRGRAFRLRVEIGAADFASRPHFPFLEADRDAYECGALVFHPVSVGNPHAVVLLDREPDAAALLPVGERLERDRLFPDRCNVEFVFRDSPGSCRVLFWERGAGRTLASSTGSAAVFAVLRRLNLAGEELTVDGGGEPVRVQAEGASLFVENTTRVILRAAWWPA